MQEKPIKHQKVFNKNKAKEAHSTSQALQTNEPSGLTSPYRSSDLSKSKNSEKQRLIDQNIRLKTQIFDLSRQLDEIMEREQKRKKKQETGDEQDDQQMRNKKIQLRKQQLQVLSLKNKIHSVKRQLETVFNNRTLIAKQDELKYLRNELETLEEQKKSLLKIKKQQTKALKVLKSEEQYEQRIDDLKKELIAAKEQSRTLNEKLIESERILRKNHEQYILKQNKVKDLQQKLIAGQQKLKKNKPLQDVTPEMITQLEQEVAQLQRQRKETEKTWHDKIHAIDTELREKKNEEQKKMMLLKQKQKQLKLNELKIKELRKLIKINISEGVEHRVATEQIDMSQYRHKRNIKYMNKND